MVAALGWPKISFVRSYENLEHTFWPAQYKVREVQQLRWAPMGIQPVCSPSEWQWNGIREREGSTGDSFRTGTHEDINEMERRNQKVEKVERLGKGRLSVKKENRRGVGKTMNDGATKSDMVGFSYMVGTLACTHSCILSSCAGLSAGEARTEETHFYGPVSKVLWRRRW